MRLFAALPVSGDALRELTAFVREFRSHGWPVRWARENGLHLTVKFLGEVAPDRLDTIEGALRGACERTRPLPFTARELGAFPTFHRAHVLWAGYESEPALELMVHRVEQAFAALDFPVEGRPFRPHVTLGRLKEGTWLPRAAAVELEDARPTGGFLAEQVVLYESHLGAGDAQYVEVLRVPLGS